VSEQDQLVIVRQRLALVEAAAGSLLDVFNRTGEERKAAVDALLAALTTDFRTAVVCSADMTDEQRAKWLSTEAGS
jgi:hypothetical protein